MFCICLVQQLCVRLFLALDRHFNTDITMKGVMDPKDEYIILIPLIQFEKNRILNSNYVRIQSINLTLTPIKPMWDSYFIPYN